MDSNNAGHRSGSFKQSNKAHKYGHHKSKRVLDQANKGRVNVKQATIKHKAEIGRKDRLNQSNQHRRMKRQEAIEIKRSLGGHNAAPILTCILPLNEAIDSASALAIIETCDSEVIVTKTNILTHMYIPSLKQRFSFIAPPTGTYSDLQILDYLKVCDSSLILISANTNDELFDKWGSRILAMASAQGIPTPILALMDLESISPKKRSQVKSNIQKKMSNILGWKLMVLDSATDGLTLLRRIGGEKRNVLPNKSNRPHIFGEHFQYSNNDLKITGFLRGTALDVNGIVHIPGLGDFQMCQIDAPVDPYRIEYKGHGVDVLAIANKEQQTPLLKENVPDEMDAEQNWPTQEEIIASMEENRNKQYVKHIPKGMSEYQAAWIPDIEETGIETNESDCDDSDEEFLSCGETSDMKTDIDEIEEELQSVSMTSNTIVTDEAYDNAIDVDEEKLALGQIKAAQEEKRFPDEIDTPQDVPARIRFQKYRGLESFRASPWDTKENLPFDYARIFQFNDYKRANNRVLKASKHNNGVPPGRYITVHVKNVNEKLWNAYQSAHNYIILYGLLPHEHQMSVVNVKLTRVAGSEIPIKSKERMIVQCGFRRFIVNPIFSQHTNGNKHKYERFFRSEDKVIATFYAPIQFKPAPILCFMENPNTTISLVATGSLISCDPNRIILKRFVLTGHPFKIHRKTATIRYMFFNKEDVEYFKPCKLRTKCGRLGHIKESLGTHGHMKCAFDGPIKSFDTVLLQLYKRVYPKWTYEECIVHTKDKMEN